MDNDKLYTIKKSTLVDIANAVRGKTGSTDLIKVSDLDDAVAAISGGGGNLYDSSIVLGFGFDFTEVKNNNVLSINEETFGIDNIKLYNSNGDILNCAYEFVGFGKTTSGSPAVDYIDTIMIKIMFNRADNPSIADITFNGMTMDTDGKYGYGYSTVNERGVVLLKSSDNWCYMLDYGRLNIISSNSLQYEFLTDNIYGGSFYVEFESITTGGGGAN